MNKARRMEQRLMSFEHRHEPLAPLTVLHRRLAKSGAIALGVLLLWVAIGVGIYHYGAGFGWVDAVYNASMIAGGMGPVDTLPGATAKLLASVYAVLSGAFLLVVVGLLLTPLLHRALHEFHVETDE